MKRSQAETYLRERYVDQVSKFPRLMSIGEALYVRRNLHAAMLIDCCQNCGAFPSRHSVIDGRCLPEQGTFFEAHGR